MEHLEINLAEMFTDKEDHEVLTPEDDIKITKEVREVIEQIKGYLRSNHLSLFQNSILDPATTTKVNRIIEGFITEKAMMVSDRSQRDLIEDIKTEFTGLGPLQPLVDDDEINDILVNSYSEVYAEKKGVLIRTNIRFRDEEHLKNIISKIINPLGKTLNMTNPVVDARIGTSRVNAMLGQSGGGLALKGSNVSIRKFPPRVFQKEELVRLEFMSEEMYSFLKDAVKASLNILVVGGTGSGKTTTLKILAGHIPNSQRVITIEDAAELNLHLLHPEKHFLPLECRSSEDKESSYTIAKLVINALRMRPDRIIIGEVRGPEAIEMLQAMNTGHTGSLTTVHANSAAESFERLVTMVKTAGLDYETSIIGMLIASAIDIIVFQRRLSDGSRKMEEILELESYNTQPVFRQLFKFTPTGTIAGKVTGKFEKKAFISDALVEKFIENQIDPDKWKG